MKPQSACYVLFCAVSISAFADETPRDFARAAILEVDAMLGEPIAMRAKAKVFTADSYTLSLEGVYGSELGLGLIADKIYGGGLRSEFVFGASGRHAWALGPGLDIYYAPSNHVSCEPATSAAGIVIYSFCELTDIPTRVTFAAPNVDASWIYQFTSRWALTLGVHGGPLIFLNGQRVDGSHLAGSVAADASLYLGIRF